MTTKKTFNPAHFANTSTTKEEATRFRNAWNTLIAETGLAYMKLKIGTVKKYTGEECVVLKFNKQTAPEFDGAKYKDVYINLVDGQMFVFGTQTYGPREVWALMGDAKLTSANVAKLAKRIHKF